METKFTQDEIEFIKNLSSEMKTQNNRSTASPYSYRVQQKVKIYGAENVYEHTGISIVGDDNYDDIGDAMTYYREFEDEESSDENETYFSDKDEFIDYLDENGKLYDVYTWEYEERLCVGHQGGTNFFFTEKACEAYIKSNRHNLSDPKSYVVHEYRNPEMEKIYGIIHKLAEVLG